MSRWKPWYFWVLGSIAVVFLLCCIGMIFVPKTQPPPVAPAPSVTVTTGPVTPVTSPAPSSLQPQPPSPVAIVAIEDGTWTVGLDFPAGTYRVTSNVSAGCYWAITKTGTNGRDIVANDLPSGGRPQVTLKKGQDFETDGCGTWHKTK